jgi:tetratricopeptide (TPR) repeat protein
MREHTAMKNETKKFVRYIKKASLKLIATLLIILFAGCATPPKKPAPKSVDYNRQGVTDYNEGNYDQAIANFSKAIELIPGLVNAYNNRGNAYYRKGLYDEAIADYDKAIELDPTYTDPYNNRGYSYYRKGLYDRAIASYDKAVKIDPEYVTAYENRGLAQYNKGEHGRAIADFTKAIALNPKHVRAHKSRGDSYYTLNKLYRMCFDYLMACELGDCKRLEAAKNKNHCPDLAGIKATNSLIAQLKDSEGKIRIEASKQLSAMGAKLLEPQIAMLISTMRYGEEKWSEYLYRSGHCSWYEDTTVKYFAADCLSKMESPYISPRIVEETKLALYMGKTKRRVTDPGWV